MALLGYTRVSTKQQDPSLQRVALLQAGVAPEHIYSDVITGASGAASRPAWAELTAYARDDDIVVVWRIDRLGRSMIDVLQTVAGLQARGIGILSVADGIDPRTPTGRLMLGILATLSEYERELINERVSAGIAAAKANGVRFGRPPQDARAVDAKLTVARQAIMGGASVAEAAGMVGWSRATYYRAASSGSTGGSE
ncbi:MAG TPA: recombinase family protein [Coriobacteriia bacterium]|nr:recombinase family protein [Coriobacteriia bacterium]